MHSARNIPKILQLKGYFLEFILQKILVYFQPFYAFFINKKYRRNNKDVTPLLQKVAESLLALDSKRIINIIYDTKESPPTYADIIPTLMLVRFLASIGKNVRFIWLNLSSNLKYAGDQNFSQATKLYLDDQRLLINYFFKNFSNITFKENVNLERNEFLLNTKFTKLKMPFYRFTPSLLDQCFMLFLKKNRKIPNRFFLNNKIYNIEKFVAIDFRFLNYDKNRNAKLSSFRRDLNLIDKFFSGSNVRIFSTADGINFLYNNLFNVEKPKPIAFKSLTISPQKSKTYSEAAVEILHSHFFFMRKGGGISVPLLFSTVPYLILSNLRHELPYRSSNGLFAISNKDQQFIGVVNRKRLKKIIKTDYASLITGKLN
jgi:hypothetical protein